MQVSRIANLNLSNNYLKGSDSAVTMASNTFVGESEDHFQHPSGRIGKPIDIASLVLFLCSDAASFINGENICVDGGMSKQMIYHNDYNWVLKNKS